LEIKSRESLSFEEVALRFGVRKSSVSRWAKRLEPCLTRKKPATKINPDRLIRDVEQHPDAYQHERAERFGCSQRGICEALKRLKISRKKNFFPSKG
jgi:transposase